MPSEIDNLQRSRGALLAAKDGASDEHFDTELKSSNLNGLSAGDLHSANDFATNKQSCDQMHKTQSR